MINAKEKRIKEVARYQKEIQRLSDAQCLQAEPKVHIVFRKRPKMRK